MTLAAVDRGLPVLVEKPLTLDVGEAEAILDQARSKGAIVLVDHIYLYSAAWEALKREGIRLGPIRTITAKGGRWGGSGPIHRCSGTGAVTTPPCA